MAKSQGQPDNESFKEQRDILKEINAELGKQINSVRDASKAYTTLENVARQLQNSEEDITKLNEKQLESLKQRTAEAVRELKQSAERIQQEKGINNLNNISKKIKKSLSSEEKAILAAAQQKFETEEKFLNTVENELDEYKKVNKQLGIMGGALKGLSKIPIVGDIFDAEQALESAREKTKETKSGVQGIGAAFKNIGTQIKEGMLNPSNMVLGAMTFLIDTFIQLDKSAGEFAKSQNMTYQDALKARESYSSMAASSGDLSLNAKNLMETQTAIGEQLGTNAKLNEADLKTFTKLREQAGFTNEELMGIQQLSLVNGKSLEQNTKEILGGAKAFASRNKLVVNEKQVLKEVSKASAALKLSLGGSTKAIAESVVQAKKFGLTLEQTEKMSQSLLNFEDSIESELSAELITGKDLNLERARGLALNGKTAEAAAEIAAQVGSSAEFGKMNVIQQEAIAKAIGMERNELAQSLIDKEALAKIGFKDAEAAKAKYEELRKTMTAEEAAAALGDEELAKQYEQQSNAEKFAQTMEHVKEIFVSIVDGPLGAILNGLSEMLKSTKVIYTITGLLAGVYAGKMVGGIVQTIAKIAAMTAANTANAAAATAGATAMSFGAIIPIILAGVGAVAGLIASFTADDLMSAPPGYGKRTLVGPEGAIQLNDKDTVIAGTNLFGNDVKSEPGKPTQFSGKGEYKLNGDSSAVVNAIAELRRDVNALANRPINVAIDGKKVIEATTGAQPNTTGDESRKNSYQIS
jgi:hypothetical protein